MLPRSIKRRLPLSYAAIALLATLVLGLVLMSTLRRIYTRQERLYMQRNAEAASDAFARMVESGLLTDRDISGQAEVLAFLTQTRILLLTADQHLWYDTGSPGERQVFNVSVEFAPTGLGRTAPQTFQPRITFQEDTATGEQVVQQGYYGRYSLNYGGITGEDSIYAVSSIGSIYGFGVTSNAALDGTRSSQVVQTPIHGGEGQLLGYVQMSEGPAYGRSIVNGVARAWGFASVIAVVAAAGIGWWVSAGFTRPLWDLAAAANQMAAGDLTARAAVRREDEFGVLSRTFNKMADQIEQMVQTLKRFIADSAHELHTPLTGIRSAVELARHGDPANREIHLDRALNLIARFEALTSSLLDLSRIEAGEGTCASFNLSALLREHAELLASRAEQAGLDFTLTLPPAAVYLCGQPTQIVRAVNNLVDNALKFTPEGGKVCITVRQHAKRIVLTIEDTGIGIPAEDLPLLFNRFHRGRNTSAYSGSGLGLAIVHAIALTHGGSVHAENTDQGARFMLSLPR